MSVCNPFYHVSTMTVVSVLIFFLIYVRFRNFCSNKNPSNLHDSNENPSSRRFYDMLDEVHSILGDKRVFCHNFNEQPRDE